MVKIVNIKFEISNPPQPLYRMNTNIILWEPQLSKEEKTTVHKARSNRVESVPKGNNIRGKI